MALRWLIALSLVSLAMGQNNTTNATEAMTTMTEAMTTMTEAMTTPMPTDPPVTDAMTTPMPTDSPITLANMNLSIAVRYEFNQAQTYRNMHFFCPDQGRPFPERTSVDNTPDPRIWSIFLQYPVLAYLDSEKKWMLIEQIVNLMRLGTVDPPVDVTNICIGRVFHYDVSLYTESVLIQLYRRDYATQSAPTATQMRGAFESGYNMALQQGLTQYVRPYDGGRVGAIVISNSTVGRVNQNVHPGAFTSDGVRFEAALDPTLNAVVLGSWDRPLTLQDFATNAELNNSVTFAENPNPVFYGLTGGDIVFAVIATILCALLAFLMVFGFCIQPFFM